jgi:hypothetical protein
MNFSSFKPTQAENFHDVESIKLRLYKNEAIVQDSSKSWFAISIAQLIEKYQINDKRKLDFLEKCIAGQNKILYVENRLYTCKRSEARHHIIGKVSEKLDKITGTTISPKLYKSHLDSIESLPSYIRQKILFNESFTVEDVKLFLDGIVSAFDQHMQCSAVILFKDYELDSDFRKNEQPLGGLTPQSTSITKVKKETQTRSLFPDFGNQDCYEKTNKTIYDMLLPKEIEQAQRGKELKMQQSAARSKFSKFGSMVTTKVDQKSKLVQKNDVIETLNTIAQ